MSVGCGDKQEAGVHSRGGQGGQVTSRGPSDGFLEKVMTQGTPR